mmetsp:Transcript_3098/g.7726  ORF Transcript_3098/g.7726 Transcript_3098/m.7726 type:complete len:237 (-) Transcript_3098:217-927(-)
MVAHALVACALAYQLSAGLRAPVAAHVVMQFRLNNYALEAPPKPLNNQLLIKLNKVDDKTDGGLFVPTGSSEKPKEGTVVAAGPGGVVPATGKQLSNPYAAGDLVLLSEYSGEKVDYNSEKHIFCDANDVLGKFSGERALVSQFIPAPDRVLVTIDETAAQTSSGIALALDNASDDNNMGKVVAVGEAALSWEGTEIPVQVAVGESVIYKPSAGVLVVIEGKKYKLVSSSECLAKW